MALRAQMVQLTTLRDSRLLITNELLSELASAVNPTKTAELHRTVKQWMTSSNEHVILAKRLKDIYSERLGLLTKRERDAILSRKVTFHSDNAARQSEPHKRLVKNIAGKSKQWFNYYV